MTKAAAEDDGRSDDNRNHQRYHTRRRQRLAMMMKTYRFFWTTHKWTGIALSVFFVVTAATGFLLLIKKKVDWIQPPMSVAAEGGVEDFITNQELFHVIFKQEHAEFSTIDDIDRVDFRPGDRVFKVRSRGGYSEIQICAVTGDVLSVGWRGSDLFERIHDGSIVGDWFHAWIMPLVSFGLLFLVFSGIWLWIEPVIRRSRRRRRARREREAFAAGHG